MTIPNLGTTGLVQLPGIGGVIGQNLSALAQTLMARQQAEEERRRNEANAAYMRAQTEAAARAEQRAIAEAERQRAQEEEVGATIRDYLTPVEQTVNLPMFGAPGMPGAMGDVAVTGTRERTLPEVLKGRSAGAVESIVGKLQGMEQTREQKQVAKRAEQEHRKYMNTMPPSVRPAMEIAFNMSRVGITGDVISPIVRAKLDEQSNDPRTVQSYRKMFPQLKDLSDEEVRKIGNETLAAQMLLRYAPKPVTGGSGGGTRPNRTADELRADMRVIGGMIDDQRARLDRLSKVPAEFTLPDGMVKPIMKPDEKTRYDAWQKSVTEEQKRLNDLTREQNSLYTQLEAIRTSGVTPPPDGGGVSVTVAPKSPTESIQFDAATGRRIAVDSITGNRRYIDPPR